MKTIMVTGCAGFIGGHVTERLLSDGYDILGVDCLTYAGNMDLMDRLQNSHKSHFTFDQKRIGELSSSELEHVDLVVNLAAETHVDNSIKSSDPFVQTNIVETHHLLEKCRESNTPILHFSTDEVYGVVLDGSFCETDPLKPKNPYSATKAAIDHLITSYQNTYGLQSTIIRPSNNFGPRQNDEKFIPTITRSIRNQNKIPVYGEGQQVREWTYVKHTAAAVSFLCNKLLQGECFGEIFNFGTSIEMKNVDLVKKLCKIIGVSFEDSVEFVTDRPGHDFRYSVNCKKISNLGFLVEPNINKELEETLEELK